jgi:hypothetical protein
MFLVGAGLVAAPPRQLQSAAADGEWRAWAADKASTRYSPLEQINRDTVKGLKIAWRQPANPDGLKQVIPNLRRRRPTTRTRR